MVKKFYLIAASVIVFLFVSTAHACPTVNLTLQRSRLDMNEADHSPCGNEKRDICQSVRDSIVSLKPSGATPDNPQPTILPSGRSIKGLVSFFPSSAATGVHPVFRLPLAIASIVLRI